MKKIMLAGAVLCLPAAAFCEEGSECDSTPGFAATVSVGIGLGGNPCDVEEHYGESKLLTLHTSVKGKEHYGADFGGETDLNEILGWFENGDAANSIPSNKQKLDTIKGYSRVNEIRNGDYTGVAYHTTQLSRNKSMDRHTRLNADVGLGLNYTADNGFTVGLQVRGIADSENKVDKAELGLVSETTSNTQLKSGRFGVNADLTLGWKLKGTTAFIGVGGQWQKTTLDRILHHQDALDIPLINVHAKQNKVRPEILIGFKKPLGNNTKVVTSLSYAFPKNKSTQYGYTAVGLPYTLNFRTDAAGTTLIENAAADTAPLNKNTSKRVDNEMIFVSDPGSVKLKQKGAFSVSVAAEYSFPFSGM